MTAVALLFSTALAGRPPLEPQIQVHGGLSLVQTPARTGGMLGMDSRLTRFVWVDLGAFVTLAPLPAPNELDLTGSEAADFFRLRHSIYILPGFRIPHPQPSGFSWEVLVRGGPAVVWSADLAPNDPRTTPNTQPFLEVDVSGMAGLDLKLQREHVGLRGSAKFFALTPFSEKAWTDVLITGPQVGVEFFYEL